MPPRAKRFAWLLLAAFAVVLAPVMPQAEPLSAATDQCESAEHCGDRGAASGTNQPATDCVVCVPCGQCCYAVLPAAGFPGVALVASPRWTHRAEIGRERNDPPPLPPPRWSV